jgi:hypothetical protein
MEFLNIFKNPILKLLLKEGTAAIHTYVLKIRIPTSYKFKSFIELFF